MDKEFKNHDTKRGNADLSVKDADYEVFDQALKKIN